MEKFAPWKDHLFTLEKELNLENNEIKYVLFEDATKSWRIQCVPADEHSFSNRLNFSLYIFLDSNFKLFN